MPAFERTKAKRTSKKPEPEEHHSFSRAGRKNLTWRTSPPPFRPPISSPPRVEQHLVNWASPRHPSQNACSTQILGKLLSPPLLSLLLCAYRWCLMCVRLTSLSLSPLQTARQAASAITRVARVNATRSFIAPTVSRRGMLLHSSPPTITSSERRSGTLANHGPVAGFGDTTARGHSVPAIIPPRLPPLSPSTPCHAVFAFDSHLRQRAIPP